MFAILMCPYTGTGSEWVESVALRPSIIHIVVAILVLSLLDYTFLRCSVVRINITAVPRYQRNNANERTQPKVS
jgi:hypothetical protein